MVGLDELIRLAVEDSLEGIVAFMHDADDRRRSSGTRYKHAIETDLKAAVHEHVAQRTGVRGHVLSRTELPIEPVDWPRVGDVDVVITAVEDATSRAFIELKWARTDKLWFCAWDLAKAALVRHTGLAPHSLLLVGASDEERATRYGSLLTSAEWDTRAFLRRYRDAIAPFCRRDEGFEHPRGPYRLPALFRTQVLVDETFSLRRRPWSLVLVDVNVPPNTGWVDLDDTGASRS